MKVIAFIESCQRNVIDRILRHLALDPQSRPRADPRAPPPGREAGGPPPGRERDVGERFHYVPDLEHRTDLAPDEGPQVDPRIEAREAHDSESCDPAF